MRRKLEKPADKLTCFKVSQQGELVDMRQLSFAERQQLLDFYESKLNRARSRDMQIAYGECVKQIRDFMFDNHIEDKMDIFSVAYQMGLTNVRSMIKTYFGELKTDEEQAKEGIKEFFEKRQKIYSGFDLPSDKVTREIFNLVMFAKLEKGGLAGLQKAADIFSNAYHISSPLVKMEPSGMDEIALFYSIGEKIVYLYPENIESTLSLVGLFATGLFEHLCELQSWKFHQDPLESFELQRKETERYMERFLDRCVALGLIHRKK